MSWSRQAHSQGVRLNGRLLQSDPSQSFFPQSRDQKRKRGGSQGPAGKTNWKIEENAEADTVPALPWDGYKAQQVCRLQRNARAHAVRGSPPSLPFVVQLQAEENDRIREHTRNTVNQEGASIMAGQPAQAACSSLSWARPREVQDLGACTGPRTHRKVDVGRGAAQRGQLRQKPAMGFADLNRLRSPNVVA